MAHQGTVAMPSPALTRIEHCFPAARGSFTHPTLPRCPEHWRNWLLFVIPLSGAWVPITMSKNSLQSLYLNFYTAWFLKISFLQVMVAPHVQNIYQTMKLHPQYLVPAFFPHLNTTSFRWENWSGRKGVPFKGLAPGYQVCRGWNQGGVDLGWGATKLQFQETSLASG